MKTKLLACTAVLGLLAVGGCHKNEMNSSGKKADEGTSTVARAVGPPSSYGCFAITNLASNKVLEVRGDTALMRAQSNPKNVQQYANFDSGLGTSQNQKWYLIQQGTGTIADNTAFKIMNVANGLYLEAPDGTNGSQLFMDHANAYPSQVWYLHKVGSTNNYYIQNNNGLVLTNFNGSTDNGAAITQRSLANNNTQYWTFNSIQAEAYRDDQVVQFFRRNLAYPTKMGSIAFDQASSIPLSDGRTLWIAEDTYTDNIGGFNGTFPCQGDGKSIWFFDIRNSVLVQPSTTNWDNTKTQNLIAGNSTYQYEVLKSPGDGSNAHGSSYTWPGVGIQVDNHVYMYAHEGGNKADNSAINATVLYDFNVNSGLNWGSATRLAIPNLTNKSANLNVDYPAGMVRPNNGTYVYAYGNFSDSFGGKYLVVARYPASNPANWTFWNGTDWVATPNDAGNSAAQLTVNNGKGVGTNNSVAYINGKYVLLEMDFGFGCPDANSAHNLYISTATSPTGPFVNRKKLYTISDKINGVLANHYVTNIHPQFNNGRNELLVTYCLNYTGCPGVAGCTGGRTDPYYYQAKAVRIPYATAGL